MVVYWSKTDKTSMIYDDCHDICGDDDDGDACIIGKEIKSMILC